MKNLISMISLSSFICLVSACSNTPVNTTKVNILTNTSDNTFIADTKKVENGADFSVRIDFSSFKTKANINGTPAKTSANVTKYLVYLVKNGNTANYPLNGDPLTTPDLVAGPFTLTNSGSSKTVTFSNVGSSGGQAYYAAIRAQDVGNNDLIKVNNGSGTAWGTETQKLANGSGKLAVSTGSGIIVDNLLAVSSTTAMTVTPQLADGIGATLEASVTPNDGSPTLPAITGF